MKTQISTTASSFHETPTTHRKCYSSHSALLDRFVPRGPHVLCDLMQMQCVDSPQGSASNTRLLDTWATAMKGIFSSSSVASIWTSSSACRCVQDGIHV
ncbi:uncharacterized [Tachysurus ichikawai]